MCQWQITRVSSGHSIVSCCNYSQVASFHWHSPTIWQSLWVTNQQVSSQTSVDIYVHWKIGKIILRDKRHLRVISVIHHLLQSFQQSNRFRKLVLGYSVFSSSCQTGLSPLALECPTRCFHDGNCSHKHSSWLIDGQSKPWKMHPVTPHQTCHTATLNQTQNVTVGQVIMGK